jgi:hypothetical protein
MAGTSHTDATDWKAVAYFILLGIAAFALLWFGHTVYEYGGIAAAPPHDHRPGYYTVVAAHVLIELGVACVIAIILALTIDKRLKDEVRAQFEQNQRAIQENVFRHVYGFSLPKDVVLEIESQLLRHRFIRTHLTVKYELADYPAVPGHVLVTTTLDYEVQNTSRNAEDYPITWFSDAPADPAHAAACALLRFEFWCEGRKEEKSQAALMGEARRDQVEGHYVWEKTFSIPPEKSARVIRRMCSLKRRDYDHDVFVTDNPTSKMVFEVDVDPALGLDVQAYTFHPKQFCAHPGHSPDQGQYRWTVEAPVLCFQGGFVTWRVRPAPPPHPPAAAQGGAAPAAAVPVTLNGPTG